MVLWWAFQKVRMRSLKDADMASVCKRTQPSSSDTSCLCSGHSLILLLVRVSTALALISFIGFDYITQPAWRGEGLRGVAWAWKVLLLFWASNKESCALTILSSSLLSLVSHASTLSTRSERLSSNHIPRWPLSSTPHCCNTWRGVSASALWQVLRSQRCRFLFNPPPSSPVFLSSILLSSFSFLFYTSTESTLKKILLSFIFHSPSSPPSLSSATPLAPGLIGWNRKSPPSAVMWWHCTASCRMFVRETAGPLSLWVSFN